MEEVKCEEVNNQHFSSPPPPYVETEDEPDGDALSWKIYSISLFPLFTENEATPNFHKQNQQHFNEEATGMCVVCFSAQKTFFFVGEEQEEFEFPEVGMKIICVVLFHYNSNT